MKVKFAKLHPEATLPNYAKLGDAGLDLTAISMNYNPMEGYYEYKFGLSVEIPEGYLGLLMPRSSTTKQDLVLGNSVGLVDSGYRGELTARFKRTKESPKTFSVGERICQLVILPYPNIVPVEVSYNELSQTERGSGGYGSSGK